MFKTVKRSSVDYKTLNQFAWFVQLITVLLHFKGMHWLDFVDPVCINTEINTEVLMFVSYILEIHVVAKFDLISKSTQPCHISNCPQSPQVQINPNKGMHVFMAGKCIYMYSAFCYKNNI